MSLSLADSLSLGRIRWQGSTPSLMGRALTTTSRVQVFVQGSGGSNGAGDGVWLDADVVSIASGKLELRTSFARFVAEPVLSCRWPLDASPLTRRELEQVFADSVAEVTREMAGLVKRFQDDPQLKTAPQAQLLAYSVAMSECSEKVHAISALMEQVSHSVFAQGDRSILVVGQESRVGGFKL